MPTLDFSIDLHCHPQYKPIGKSYRNNKMGNQAARTTDRSSLWFYDPPKGLDTLLNKLFGLTKFSQTNLTASLYGRVWVMAVSLGSIEKWFFCSPGGTERGLKDLKIDLATGLGDQRIDAIQGTNDYFSDLLAEYAFIKEQEGKVVNIDGMKCTYRFVRDFEDLEQVVTDNELIVQELMNGSASQSAPLTIALIPSIEGLHVLNCGLDQPCESEIVLNNARALKNHPNRPWFVTFSHHFYNELCGHARSLAGHVARTCDQSKGLDTGFTNLGRAVLDILLDDKTGPRILIDIKHMSPTGRREYLNHIRDEQGNYRVPVIISHGGCNGLPAVNNAPTRFSEVGRHLNDGEINFYDEEVIAVARSGGIMGLQLDERRIASRQGLQMVRDAVLLNKRMHYRSELLWKQLQYIAELLDAQGLPAWECIAMGSDYDGLVDPLNTFWTFEQYKDLKSYLERHAHNYMNRADNPLQLKRNKISADEIIQNLFQMNAWRFFQKWFGKQPTSTQETAALNIPATERTGVTS